MSEAGLSIQRALNLPKNALNFTLSMKPGEAVTVEVEYFADKSSAGVLATVLKRYKLVEISDQPASENLVWHQVHERLPDADITVLCWHAGDREFWTGYWDGNGWIGCESGGSVLGVTHWAEPQGPQC